MGMDLYGKNPATENGNYFRNNVWWWRLLYTYCVEKHSDLLGDEPDRGHYNDGYEIGKVNAAKLGVALLQDLDDGTVTEYKNSYNAYVSELPRLRCHLCEGTGIRTDSVGVEQLMHEKELDALTASYTHRTHGWCNVCEGLGSTSPFEAKYRFDEDNVRNFANFCISSGGFEIL